MNLIKSLFVGVIALTANVSAVPVVSAAVTEEVNIYSFRQPLLIDPIVNEFTESTGIKVNVVFAKKGLIERLKREGKYSPADIVLTTDISRLVGLAEQGLTQVVDSDALEKNIPAQYRDPENQWFGLTLRVRNIYSAKDRQGALDINYEDLADAKYKGKICTRSGKHDYNVALVSSMIAHHGADKTKTWLKGFKDNLARRPQGNDRAQVKAVKEGECDLALGNSYYYGNMLMDEKQRPWAESVHINFPNQKNRGSHVNLSGMTLAKYAPNKAAAIKLMAFLSDNTAQKMYAEINMEYPVKVGVAPSALVASWGDYKADNLALDNIAKNRKAALRLLDEVKFDL
jgi:iron(III) transport system substrate-binding protein